MMFRSMKCLLKFQKKKTFIMPSYLFSGHHRNIDAITTIYAPSKSNVYIDLISGTLPLYLESTILEYKERIAKENPDYHHSNEAEIKFYNKKMEEYALSTPIFLIIFSDFYFRFDNKFFLVLTDNNKFYEYPSKETEGKFFNLKSVINESNVNFVEQKILYRFLQKIFLNFEHYDEQKISTDSVKTILFNGINETAIEGRRRVEEIDSEVKMLEERVHELEEKKLKFLEKVKVKSKRRLNMLFGLMTGQVAFFQYCTYFAFSWDIVEPMTCLFGILDLIIAYAFFLRHNEEYSYPAIDEKYSLKRQVRFESRKENLIDETRLIELKRFIQKLNNEKIFFSNDLDAITKNLMSKIDNTDKEDID